VGEEEIEKLLRRGGDWLASHPEREHITQRYLKHQLPLTRAALAQLGEEDDEPLSETTEARHDAQVRSREHPGGLHEQRLQAVLAVLRARQASRLLDLGCGEGKLLRLLLRDKGFSEIVGLDVSYRRLEYAAKALHLDNLPDRQRQRIKLMQGSLIYRDERLAGYDAAAVVEVIEHLDAPRLAAFERVLFEFARPKTIIITTPNREYNVMWPSLPAGKLRHRDHRFEWTRAEFKKWAKRMAAQYGYSVSFEGIGPQDKNVGTPTQMGVFTR
jgi:3' terminal RNA ribose 2'-O-methyltransferase Hen1